jgi:hypothetical protein
MGLKTRKQSNKKSYNSKMQIYLILAYVITISIMGILAIRTIWDYYKLEKNAQKSKK